jgi:Na+/H+-dicarboxylate symporter/ABC-type amino acid transport substrate-binding protein
VLIGLIAGAFVGLFLGERSSIFQIAADGFVKLLQMAVLPYLTVTITASIGGLRLEALRALGVRTLAVLAGLWAIAFAFAFAMPLTFPSRRTGAFFSTTLLEPTPALNLVDLYIPANPFFALANNIVPGVVVFSVVVGIAMIAVPDKQQLLDVLVTASRVLARAMRFVTQLTPYGIFAIVASIAGTVRLEELGRLEVYLVAYAALALLLGLWVLPGLVSALTPIPARAIFAATHEALLTAAIAGDLFIVLPILISASKDLVAQYCPTAADAHALPDLIVPIAYNFPHCGKLLSVSFILFAGWFSDAIVRPADYPQLAVAALATLFGSITAAIPYLLDLFRIPADTFQLFLASSVINSRLGSLVAAMHTVALALLGTCAVTGLLRWRGRALLRYGVITASLAIAVLGATRLVAENLLYTSPGATNVLDTMQVRQPVAAVVRRSEPAPDGESPPRPRLDAILERGTLRVGYLHDSLPFAFLNQREELVGFDVALMHQLARELGVSLEFVPAARAILDHPSAAAALLRGGCDLLIGGIAVTASRAGAMQISSTYLTETLGFVVRDDARSRFGSWEEIRRNRDLTIAVPPVPYYADKLRQRLPNARLVTSATTDDAFASLAAGASAVALPAERGSAWTLRYPQYSVAVPMPDLIKVPLAYAMPTGEPALTAFVNTWLDLKRHDGTIEALYQYWILGRAAEPLGPRWSIMRNVLHWVP